MNIMELSVETELKDVRRQREELDDRLIELLGQRFPVGTEVAYSHGRGEAQGTVEGINHLVPGLVRIRQSPSGLTIYKNWEDLSIIQ